jgi:SsrA-binding protein
MRPTGTKVIATNRQARRNYDVLDTIEAGIVLRGSEVKSLRDAKVQIADAFARIDSGEIWLHGLHIERLRSRVDPEQLSLVPLSIYFKDGRAKVELALAKGRKTHDKRQAIAERDAAMDVRRAMKSGGREE